MGGVVILNKVDPHSWQGDRNGTSCHMTETSLNNALVNVKIVFPKITFLTWG